MYNKPKICQEVDEAIERFYAKNELKPWNGANDPDCPANSIRTKTPRQKPDWLKNKGPSFKYCFSKGPKPGKASTTKKAQRPKKRIVTKAMQEGV